MFCWCPAAIRQGDEKLTYIDLLVVLLPEILIKGEKFVRVERKPELEMSTDRYNALSHVASINLNHHETHAC